MFVFFRRLNQWNTNKKITYGYFQLNFIFWKQERHKYMIFIKITIDFRQQCRPHCLLKTNLIKHCTSNNVIKSKQKFKMKNRNLPFFQGNTLLKTWLSKKCMLRKVLSQILITNICFKVNFHQKKEEGR